MKKTTEAKMRALRKKLKVFPVAKQIDTLAGEFPAQTNYLYLTYHGDVHDIEAGKRSVVVLGSGPYTIGSSVEFDWSSVQAANTLKREGYRTIMINYNPETVSTGGQIPNNLALPLKKNGVRIFGTRPEDIDRAEDRHVFSKLLDTLGVDQPAWAELTTEAAAEKAARAIGYPVLVRPSYVLSGSAMKVAPDAVSIKEFLKNA